MKTHRFWTTYARLLSSCPLAAYVVQILLENRAFIFIATYQYILQRKHQKLSVLHIFYQFSQKKIHTRSKIVKSTSRGKINPSPTAKVIKVKWTLNKLLKRKESISNVQLILPDIACRVHYLSRHVPREIILRCVKIDILARCKMLPKYSVVFQTSASLVGSQQNIQGSTSISYRHWCKHDFIFCMQYFRIVAIRS